MPHTPHRIRRLRWMVRTNSAAEAFTLRKRLHNQWQELLRSSCERAFDEAAPGDEVIHIPKLELHVTVSAEADLLQVLPDLIREQLRENLRIQQTDPLQEPMESDQRRDRAPSPQPPLDWQTISGDRTAIDQLLHYLRTGSVPWSVAHIAPADIAVMLQQICQQHWQPLLDYVRRNPEPAVFYVRLLQLLPETEWLPLVTILFEPLPIAWQQVMQQLVSAVLAPGQTVFSSYQQHQLVAEFLADGVQSWATHRPLESRVILDKISRYTSAPATFYSHLLQRLPENEWLPLLTVLLESLPVAWGSAVVQAIAAILAADPRLFTADQQRQLVIAFLVESLRDLSDRPPDGRAILETVLGADTAATLQTWFVTLPDSVAHLFQSPPLIHPPTPSDLPVQSVATTDEPSLEAAPQITDGFPLVNGDRAIDSPPDISPAPVWAIAADDLDFPLSIHYAGLMLLHPFIPPYFAAVGADTSTPEAIARSAALLHFLATGTEAVYEYELGLIKVLLGFSLDTPLAIAAGLLQASDREEAETLLQSAIHYWSVLRNTSVVGLRTSFLQRSGLLRETADGWHLHVEPQAFDMLLNDLPWGIAIVKFPWMPKPLYTEWPTP